MTIINVKYIINRAYIYIYIILISHINSILQIQLFQGLHCVFITTSKEHKKRKKATIYNFNPKLSIIFTITPTYLYNYSNLPNLFFPFSPLKFNIFSHLPYYFFIIVFLSPHLCFFYVQS